MTNLVGDHPCHVSLRSLQSSECLAEVELDIVPLAFHADSQQQTALRVEVKPVFARHEVAEVGRIQLDRGATDAVMVAQRIPVPYSGNHVQRSLRRDIERLLPPRVQVAVDDASLAETFLILIPQYHVRVAEAVDVAGLEVLPFDDLDGEDKGVGLSLTSVDRGTSVFDDLGQCIDVDALLQVIKLMSRPFNVVELDERLRETEVSTLAAVSIALILTSGKNWKGSIFSLLVHASLANCTHRSWRVWLAAASCSGVRRSISLRNSFSTISQYVISPAPMDFDTAVINLAY